MTKPQIRLLLVDDDLVDRMACRRALAQNPEYEFVLSEAETGREGLRLAHAQKPECVLLDYHLPDLNGLEFLAELRNNQDDVPVPVMMLTGTDNASVAVEAMKRGAQDYLIKDANRQYLELLPAVIQRVLREQHLLREKKQAEQELKDLSDRLQHILASTPAVHYACRVDGEHFVPTYASPNLKGIWGYDLKECLGNAEWWWSGIHPEERDSLVGTIRAALVAADRSHYSHEYRFRHKDGTYRWVHDELQIIRGQAGQPLEIVGSWLDITERKQMEHQLRDLAAHLQTVREEEKAGIAREIHDDLGSTLTALKMGTHQLKAELSQDKNAKPLLEQVESLSQLINIAAGFTRHIISDLRPTILDDLGLLAAIEWQAAQFHKRTGIECRVNCIGDKGDLDKLRSIALFRILQEALTNVTRHSGASRVEIEFHHSDEEVVLSIHDNGCGLPEGRAVKSGSYGMLGMIERVEQLGGTIRFDTPPGGGLGVTVIFPLPAEKWSI
ncbi:MAG: response regulator [Betaproteobacteria bacterium]|nr:response regulator [Betaproteobacteria bacterium]